MPKYEVASGEGRTEKEIYQQEIANVIANRFMTDREKAIKIKQLNNLINPASK